MPVFKIVVRIRNRCVQCLPHSKVFKVLFICSLSLAVISFEADVILFHSFRKHLVIGSVA